MKKIIILFAFVLALAFAVKLNTYAYTNETDITVSITAVYDTGNVVQIPVVADYGTKVSFNGSISVTGGYTFAYWVVNGTVREDLGFSNQFTITGTLNLVAVFRPAGKWAVLFMDTNGKLLKTQYVNDTANADDSGITWPTKLGYTISETKWDGVLTNITENKVFLLQYTLASAAMFNLVVNGAAPVAYAYNTAVTINAAATQGADVFSHWIEDGVVVSRDLEYTLTMLKNRTLTAVYQGVADANTPEVTISNDFALRTGYQTYMGQLYVPQTYELIEYGFITSQTYSNISLNTPGVTVAQSNNKKDSSDEFVTSFPTGSNVSIKAYLVTKVGGSLVTSYSREINQVEVLNKGFETGNINGWNSYGLWKSTNTAGVWSGELSMISYSNGRIANGTYFDGNFPYNRDGSYNIGVTGTNVSWGQAEERMGHLRSSNFILSAASSGWISFKLGGGRFPSFAYLSVRRAADNVEVARFGNRHWNNTSLSGTGNAEAYMFQYYFDLEDLSAVSFGDSLYFVLSETSSFNWSILTADSFETNIISTPSPTSDQLAANILPNILGTDTATAQIKSGNPFAGSGTSITDWSNVDGKFKLDWDPKGVRSDEGGDGVIGVLRSSAFLVDSSYKYLKFDFAGGREYDKQVFISIKEVGSNIEVMRIIRRDGWNNGDNWFEHHVDLTSLSTTGRQYYIELSDNVTSGWGLIMIKNMRLSNTYNSGNAAGQITTLVTNFTYDYKYINPTQWW